MKKLIAVLVAVLLPLCFACAETDAAVSPLEENYYFSVQSTGMTEPANILVDTDFAAALALLGEPLSCFESESCAFQGLDKVFTFPGFMVNTYPQEGLDFVASVFLMDDTVTTVEGAYIGMHIDELAPLYPEMPVAAESSVSYTKGGCVLSFMHDADGYITAITYTSLTSSAQ